MNIAIYAGNLYPGSSEPTPAELIAELQDSKFTTIILSLFHVSSGGTDFVLNNTTVISNGSYVGDQNWPKMVKGMIKGNITTVCASIGGWGVQDFENINEIYKHNPTFKGTTLEKNFKLLREMFPAITVIDFDCEENYYSHSLVAFAQMLISIGFKITFCPYTQRDFWVDALGQLEASNKGNVLWFNLQCYAGGAGNQPEPWSKAITNKLPKFNTDEYILVSNWTRTDDGTPFSPEEVGDYIKSLSGSACVGGAFLWNLDNIVQNMKTDSTYTIKAYANAVYNSLLVDATNI